jgi:hypothetical protein
MARHTRLLTAILVVGILAMVSCSSATNVDTQAAEADQTLVLDRQPPPSAIDMSSSSSSLDVPLVRMPRRLPGNGTEIRPFKVVKPPTIIGKAPACANIPRSPDLLYPDDPSPVDAVDPGLRDFYGPKLSLPSMATIELCESSLPTIVYNPPVAGASSRLQIAGGLMLVVLAVVVLC